MLFSLAIAAVLAATPILHAQEKQGAPLPTNELRALADLFGVIRSDYVSEPDDAKLIVSCMRGMMRDLDPQSAYLDAESFNELRMPSSKDAAGIGLDIGYKAGLPSVVSARDGSPAHKAGLLPKDYILAIDGESMEETALADVVKKIRGAPGSKITLTIRRPGETSERVLTLVREVLPASKAKAYLIQSGIGYMQLGSFLENTGAEVRAAFTDMTNQSGGKLGGLILDLRNNSGGLLRTSGEIAAMFLPKDVPVFSSYGRLPDANVTFYASQKFFPPARSAPAGPWPEQMRSVPMVVLVNAGTAAGAEIVAGALQDHKRAILVGGKTYGKGSVQTIRQLSKDTAVKLTTAYWKTPSGRTIHNNGVAPDYVVQDAGAGTSDDKVLGKALELIRTAGK